MNDTKDNRYFLYAPQKLVDNIKQLYDVIASNGSFLTVSGHQVTQMEDLLTLLLEIGMQYTVSKKRTPEEINVFFQNVANFVGAVYHKADSFDVPVKVDKNIYDFIQKLISKNSSASIIEENAETKKKTVWTPDKDTLLRAFTASFLWIGLDQFLHQVTSQKLKQEDNNELLQ